MVIKRRRFKQSQSLHERLCDEAQRLRALAQELPVGDEKHFALKKARQAETASHIEEWIRSPGLQPPT